MTAVRVGTAVCILTPFWLYTPVQVYAHAISLPIFARAVRAGNAPIGGNRYSPGRAHQRRTGSRKDRLATPR